MILLEILIAIISLFFGRKLYWGLAGMGGYLAGVYFVEHSFRHASSQNILIVGIICGIIAILLAFLIRHWVIMLAAFILGGYLFTNFYPVFGGHLATSSYWPAFLVGGFIFALFFMAFFELALVLATGAIGAYFIFQLLPFKMMPNACAAVFLFFLGVKYQFSMMRRGQTQQFKEIDIERLIQENMKKKLSQRQNNKNF